MESGDRGEPAPDRAQTSLPSETDVPAEWSVGDVILGLYEVKGVLGEGGMGRVYRVHHRGWDVDLAVKSPRADVLAAGGSEAFVREAEAWAELGLHPHTVSCYYVRTLGGIPRVFAECVEGGSLHDCIRDRRIYEGGPEKALARILDVAIQFAWGLDYAHERGLVHQDVKPHNVMMTLEGTAKVADFGLAKARGGERASSPAMPGGTLLVSSGGMTPAYCSPEQAARKPLTRRTDVWSWAVSVLEMFTGEVTWASGLAAPSVLEAHLDAAIEDPGLPTIPAPVADLLRACFASEPNKRPQTMADVASTLRDLHATVVDECDSREAPSAAPDTAESLNNRALSLLDLGRHDGAQTTWSEALRLHPGHPESAYNRGLARWRLGTWTDVDVLRDLRGIEHASWQSLHAQALVHLERADAQGALDALGRASESDQGASEMRSTSAIAKRRLSASGGLVRTFEGHTSLVYSVHLSADGRYALSGSEDKTTKLWDVATGRCLRTLQEEYPLGVTSVQFAADGRHALIGSGHSSFGLWDVTTGARVRTFAGHSGGLAAGMGGTTSVHLSANGRHVLSGGNDRRLKLWEVATSRCLRTFEGHTQSVTVVHLSANGHHALSGSEDNTLKLWEVDTGRCLRTFEGHTSRVNSVHLSADGRHAASGSGDKTLKLWDVATGRCVRTLEGHTGWVNSVQVSADGRHALSSQDETLKLWELATGRCLRTFEGHTSFVNSVHWSADGRHALSGSHDNTVKLWELGACRNATPSALLLTRIVSSEAALRTRRTYEEAIRSARSELTSGRSVAAAGHVRRARALPGHEFGEQAVRIWGELHGRLPRGELQGAASLRTLEGHTRPVNSIQLSADERHVLSASDDETLRLWELDTSRCLRTFEGHTGRVRSVEFSLDGRRALSGSEDKTLKLWDVATGRCIRTFEGHAGPVSTVQLSLDGRHVLSGTAGRDMGEGDLMGPGELKFWDVATGRCLRNLVGGHEGMLTSAHLSADGCLALSSGEFPHGTLKLWDVATGRCLRTFKGHTGLVSSQWSADGRHALSGSSDKTLKLWDVATGRCLRTLEGHTESVNSIHLSADGRRALSGSGNYGVKGTLKLWELDTGRCLRTFEWLTANAVHFSAGGRHAFSSDDNGAIQVWRLDWELEDRETADWDEGARPLLEMFLRCRTPYGASLPGADEPLSDDLLTLALTRAGRPNWTDEDFKRLLTTLGDAGYGWVRPEGVRRELQRMAAEHGT